MLAWEGEEGRVWCGGGETVSCLVEGESPWLGRFGGDLCARFFDCGIHKCEKPCHHPSPRPSECPRSPSHVTHCPCGKRTIAPSSSVEKSQRTFAAAQIPSPLASPLVRNPKRCVLIHAKRNATLGPAHHAQSRLRARAYVEERRAVFLATKSATAVLVTTQQKRARSSAITHAPFSALVVDTNAVGCVVPAFSCYLS